MSHRGPAQVRRLVERVTAGSNSVAVIHHHPSGPALPFLLISGQDYPVRPMKLIEAELAASRRDGYVRHFLIADVVGFL
jgi:hypothetical protein